MPRQVASAAAKRVDPALARRIAGRVSTGASSGICELSGLRIDTMAAAQAAAHELRATYSQCRSAPGGGQASITALSADGCSLTTSGAVCLVEWVVGQTSLTEFSLADNPNIGDEGVEAVAHAVGALPVLSTLWLGSTGMQLAGSRALAEAIGLTSSLTVLRSAPSSCTVFQ